MRDQIPGFWQAQIPVDHTRMDRQHCSKLGRSLHALSLSAVDRRLSDNQLYSSLGWVLGPKTIVTPLCMLIPFDIHERRHMISLLTFLLVFFLVMVVLTGPAKLCACCRAGCRTASLWWAVHDPAALYKAAWPTVGEQCPRHAQLTPLPSCTCTGAGKNLQCAHKLHELLAVAV